MALAYPVGHFSAQAHTLGDAAILRVVEAGIRDLQTIDRGLYGWKLRCETDFAHRLRMSKPEGRATQSNLRPRAQNSASKGNPLRCE
jgi:hypothetical protein